MWQNILLVIVFWAAVAAVLNWVVMTSYGQIHEDEHLPFTWWRWIVVLWPISLLLLFALYLFSVYIWGRAWYLRRKPFIMAWCQRLRRRWAK